MPGSADWDDADRNTQECAVEGLHLLQDSPAVAAATAANAEVGEEHFNGDPFRARGVA